MGVTESCLLEFDREMAGVRKTLERVPDGKFDWQPHPKSSTLGKLATHLAMIPSYAVKVMEMDSLEVGADGKPPAGPPLLKTRTEVLDAFDRNRDAARQAIAAASEDCWSKPWKFIYKGKTIIAAPRNTALRNFVISHAIHHRAQLGVYLRMNDVPVPSIYGPSADEPIE